MVLGQNMVSFPFLSLVSLPHQITASPCARQLAQDPLVTRSQPHHPNLVHAMSPAGIKLSPSPKHPVSPPAPSETSPRAPTTALNQNSKELGQLLTGSGLGHGPGAGSFRSFGLPLSFPPLVLFPTSPGSTQEPHLLFSPSIHPQEQLPTPQAPLARYQGHGYVAKAALEVKTKMVAE